jgi:pimeloyl-ACP methyl ester carboxylesterase
LSPLLTDSLPSRRAFRPGRPVASALAAAAVLIAIATVRPIPAPSAAPAPKAAPTASSGPAPEIRPRHASFEATETMGWAVEVDIVNPLDAGLYIDSLWCEVESLDPASMGGGQRETHSLAFVKRSQGAISGGETSTFSINMPASAEHARITISGDFHDGTKKPWHLSASSEALPGPFTRTHPSRFTTANGKKVEYVVVPSPGDSVGPGILYVHGHHSSARQSLQIAQLLAARGYTVMAVSMPGYGQSEGTPDFGGPATVAALNAALDVLGRWTGVDSTRIAVWGISRGAGAALNTAARRASIRAAIGQSGTYDLWATWRAAKANHVDDLASDIVTMAGTDSAAWRERSAALAVDRFRCPVLLMHAEDDERAPFAQARGLADALQARGVTVETRFLTRGGHTIPQREALNAAMVFLRHTLAR